MAQVTKSVLVGYSARQMFELVDQVELYPQFLPWCGGTELQLRDETSTIATIKIDYMHVKQSFATENVKQAPNFMQMKLKEGPFRKLEGSWCFIELDAAACKIEFNLNYEFSSSMLDSLLGPVFNHIANSFVDAFVHRAEKVHGV